MLERLGLRVLSLLRTAMIHPCMAACSHSKVLATLVPFVLYNLQMCVHL